MQKDCNNYNDSWHGKDAKKEDNKTKECNKHSGIQQKEQQDDAMLMAAVCTVGHVQLHENFVVSDVTGLVPSQNENSHRPFLIF